MDAFDISRIEMVRDNCWEYTQRLGLSTYDVGDIKGLPLVLWTFEKETTLRRNMRRAIYLPSLFLPALTRRALSIPKTVTPQGLSFLILCYLNEYRRTNRDDSLTNARSIAAELLEIHHTSRVGRGWGLPFRFGESPAGLALSHTTQWCLTALIELNAIAPDDELKRNIDESVRYLRYGLNYHRHSDDVQSVSYTENDNKQVINISADVAAVLLYAKKHKCEIDFLEKTALDLIRFVIREQNVDGSWYYHAERHFGGPSIIDSHHTCMNLRALLFIAEQTTNLEVSRQCMESATKGIIFFLDHLVRPDGLPKSQTGNNKEVSGYASAEMLRTLLVFLQSERIGDELRTLVSDALVALLRALDGTIILPSGEVVTHKYGIFDLRVRSLRWPQAYMALAMMEACDALCTQG